METKARYKKQVAGVIILEDAKNNYSVPEIFVQRHLGISVKDIDDAFTNNPEAPLWDIDFNRRAVVDEIYNKDEIINITRKKKS